MFCMQRPEVVAQVENVISWILAREPVDMMCAVCGREEQHDLGKCVTQSCV